MSNPPNPPAYNSSLDFTKLREREARRKEAEATCRAAKKITNSLASWDSAEYWSIRNKEGEAKLKLNEIQKEIAVESESGFTGLEKRRYLERKAELHDANKSAIRKMRRYEARERIIAAAKTSNPVTARASYIELMMTLLTRTSRTDQSHFIRALGTSYGYQKIGNSKQIWSPVLGQWVSRDGAKAAHIFPLSLGQKSMTYIFGEETEEEINCARNGLFLQPEIEKAFDRHQLTIVPAKGEAVPQEWQILVLDHGGLWKTPILGGDTTFGDLHHRVLKFQPGNNYRPRARFFYFHYVMTMLKIGRSKEVEKQGISAYVPEATTTSLSKVWATQGRYLRENMIRAFIEGIGHEDPGDFDPTELLNHAKKDLPNEHEIMIENARLLDVESEAEDSDLD
jgi:hypothetical protein